jgi:hypothetical protein
MQEEGRSVSIHAILLCVLTKAWMTYSEGAAIWYLRNHVVARATRFTFGVAIDRIYDRSNPQHKARIRDKYTDVG